MSGAAHPLARAGDDDDSSCLNCSATPLRHNVSDDACEPGSIGPYPYDSTLAYQSFPDERQPATEKEKLRAVSNKPVYSERPPKDDGDLKELPSPYRAKQSEDTPPSSRRRKVIRPDRAARALSIRHLTRKGTRCLRRRGIKRQLTSSLTRIRQQRPPRILGETRATTSFRIRSYLYTSQHTHAEGKLKRKRRRRSQLPSPSYLISLPEDNPWTGGREISRIRRHIIRSMWNQDVARSELGSRRILQDPNLVEKQIKFRARTLYPFARIENTWRLWFRNLFGPNQALRNRIYNSARSLNRATKGAQWVIHHIQAKQKSVNPRVEWARLPRPLKRDYWPHAMLRCILSSPEDSLAFLDACLPMTYPSYSILGDSLFLIRHVHKKKIREDPLLRRQFQVFVELLFDVTKWPLEGFRDRHISLILEYTSESQTRFMFDRIQERGLRGSSNSWLRFMGRFTRSHDVSYALAALRKVVRVPQDLSHPAIMKKCTDLLGIDYVTKAGNTSNFKILPEMLVLGIPPNQITYNVAIENAFRSGYPRVGWDLFQFLRDNDLPRDSFTYVSLLKEAIRQQDMEKISGVFMEVFSRKYFEMSEILLAYSLHVFRVLYKIQQGPTSYWGESYPQQLALYSSRRNLVALSKLGIYRDGDLREDLPDSSGPALSVLVQTWLMNQTDSTLIRDFYERFVLLIHQEPTVSALAETDHVFNTIIALLSRDNLCVSSCFDVVQDMLHSNNSRFAKPSPTTWGILMAALVRNKHFKAARTISHSLPNEVWESIKFRRRIARHALPSYSSYSHFLDSAELVNDLDKTMWEKELDVMARLQNMPNVTGIDDLVYRLTNPDLTKSSLQLSTDDVLPEYVLKDKTFDDNSVAHGPSDPVANNGDLLTDYATKSENKTPAFAGSSDLAKAVRCHFDRPIAVVKRIFKRSPVY